MIVCNGKQSEYPILRKQLHELCDIHPTTYKASIEKKKNSLDLYILSWGSMLYMDKWKMQPVEKHVQWALIFINSFVPGFMFEWVRIMVKVKVYIILS